MTFIGKGKINWRPTLVIIVLAAMLGGGILAYQYWWVPNAETEIKQEGKIPLKTPGQVVLEFYQGYIATSLLEKDKYISFSNDLTEEYKAFLLDKKEVRLVDYVLWAQDTPPVDSLQIGEVNIENAIALVDVTFLPSHKVQVSLLLINNEWKVSNIVDKSERIIEDETIDWQTYRNEEYGFELEYPISWVLHTSKGLSVNFPGQRRYFIQLNISNGVKGPEDESMSRCQPGIAMMVCQIGKLREGQQSFEEFVDFQIENPERGTPPAVEPELIPVAVGEYNALKIEEVVDSCNAEFYYIEQGLDRYMTISLVVDEGDDRLTIDKILSTFRSLKKEEYNHAGRIVEIYQEDGKDYLNVDFIKFILFVDESGHPTSSSTYIYGENDEEGYCEPIEDPFCIVNDDQTINSYEVARDTVITPASYPGTPLLYENLGEIIINSPYFRLQIEDGIIKKMDQIYIP